jgi:hypothetical protein
MLRPPRNRAEPEPEWDENWEMFYRLGPAGVYEFADAVERGVQASGRGDVWMTHEQVLMRKAREEEPEEETQKEPAAPEAEIPFDEVSSAEEAEKVVESGVSPDVAVVSSTVDAAVSSFMAQASEELKAQLAENPEYFMDMVAEAYREAF